MKFLPSPRPEKLRGVSPVWGASPTGSKDESLGHGMDAVITLLLFLGAGFGLDRMFGTTPVFMIVLTVVGSIGVFARFYYQYEARMAAHDADRVAKLGGAPIATSPVVAENGEAA